jgi:serine/threonine protein kinase
MDNQILRQNIIKFTVKVQNYRNETVGTAFIVYRADTTCLLATCKHVVQSATEDGQCRIDTKVKIQFPQIGTTRQASVVICATDKDDDIAILQIQGHLSPQIRTAILGSALQSADSQANELKSYGYRELEGIDGAWAYGHIMGTVTALPEFRNLEIPLLQLRSTEINLGMSGSPILDLERNLVVGIISDKYFTKDLTDSATAFAIDASIIQHYRNEIPLWPEWHYPLASFPTPEITPQTTRLFRNLGTVFPLEPGWNGAPELRTWATRKQLLDKLNEDWYNPEIHLVSLIGAGGEGKTALARQWIETLILKDLTIEGIIWLNFYEATDTTNAIDTIIEYLIPAPALNSVIYEPLGKKINLIGKYIAQHKLIFVLDGLQVVQYDEGNQRGQFRDQYLILFLQYFLAIDSRSFCIITSREPLVNEEGNHYTQYLTFRSHKIGSLNAHEVFEWLDQIGVRSPEPVIENLIEVSGGYALLLSLITAEIRFHYNKELDTLNKLPQLSSPDLTTTRYEKLRHMFKAYFYSDHLSNEDRTVLVIIAAFGEPVPSAALTYFQVQAKHDMRNKSELSLNNIATRLVEGGLLLKTQNNFYFAHPLIVDECRDLLAHYSPSDLSELRFSIARYYFSHMDPEKSIHSIKQAESQGLRYLYLAFGIIDDIAKQDLRGSLDTMKFTTLPNSEYILENGTYILIGELGSGTAGEVWMAYARTTSRLVAIKRLRNEYLTYLAELAFLPNLNNDFIVRIYSVGVVKNLDNKVESIFIVMPYLRGGSLHSHMTKKKTAKQQYQPAEVNYILRCLAEGLDYLHDKKIIHQDIKPLNIVFDNDNDEAKPIIVDFGFAKLKQPKRIGATNETGDDAGTLKYLSPEKCQRQFLTENLDEIDGASDQYSVAIIVYEMLTEHWPYGTETNVYEIFQKHMKAEPIPLQTFRPDLPERINDVLFKALSKNPKDRYASVTAFADAFERAIAEEPINPVPKIATIGVVIGLIIVVLLYIFSDKCPPDCPPNDNETPIVQLTTSDVPVAANVTHITATTEVVQSPVAVTNTPVGAASSTTDPGMLPIVSPATHTPTVTNTPMISPSMTHTLTVTNTPMISPSMTHTLTVTNTPTVISTPTDTQTPSPTVDVCQWILNSEQIATSVTGFPGPVLIDVMAVGSCLRINGREEHFSGQPFRILNVPITNKQYLQCMTTSGANRCSRPTGDAVYRGENTPVAGITWHQANDFCIKLGGRLPTTSEWEYAVLGIADMGSPLGEWVADGPDSANKNVLTRDTSRTMSMSRADETIGFRCVFDVAS